MHSPSESQTPDSCYRLLGNVENILGKINELGLKHINHIQDKPFWGCSMKEEEGQGPLP